jgi:hypothetical protein
VVELLAVFLAVRDRQAAAAIAAAETDGNAAGAGAHLGVDVELATIEADLVLAGSIALAALRAGAVLGLVAATARVSRKAAEDAPGAAHVDRDLGCRRRCLDLARLLLALRAHFGPCQHHGLVVEFGRRGSLRAGARTDERANNKAKAEEPC